MAERPDFEAIAGRFPGLSALAAQMVWLEWLKMTLRADRGGRRDVVRDLHALRLALVSLDRGALSLIADELDAMVPRIRGVEVLGRLGRAIDRALAKDIPDLPAGPRGRPDEGRLSRHQGHAAWELGQAMSLPLPGRNGRGGWSNLQAAETIRDALAALGIVEPACPPERVASAINYRRRKKALA